MAGRMGIERVRKLFADADMRPGQWGLPVAWTKDDQWEKDLRELPALAALGIDLGCSRTATWCMSGSNDRPFHENLRRHVARFRPIAEVLARQECRLGMEFLGPKTIQKTFTHEFIYALGECWSPPCAPAWRLCSFR